MRFVRAGHMPSGASAPWINGRSRRSGNSKARSRSWPNVLAIATRLRTWSTKHAPRKPNRSAWVASRRRRARHDSGGRAAQLRSGCASWQSRWTSHDSEWSAPNRGVVFKRQAMNVWYIVYRTDSLTYTVAKALSVGGHAVSVWVVNPNLDHGLSAGIDTCLRETPRVSIVPRDDAALPSVIDRLIVQVFPQPDATLQDVDILARRARKITLISAGDRRRSWRHAVRQQARELRRLGLRASRVDRALYKDGFYAYDLLGLFKPRRAVGFDAHSQFIHDDELFRAMHARDWDPNKRRPILANFLGSQDPEIRKRVLDEVRHFFQSADGSSPSPSADKSMRWHEYSDAAAIGLDPREFVRVLSNSDFTLCPRGYSLVTHRPIEALLRGSVPVLSEDELDLYGVELKDGLNCLSVHDERWREAVERLARAEESEIMRMRMKIDSMFDEFLDYPAMAKRIRGRVGVES